MAKAKKGRALWWVIAIVIVCPIALATTGLFAALGIPSFLDYQRRAKNVEAEANLDAIYSGMEAYAQLHGAAHVPVIARTPVEVPCGLRLTWPEDADPAWAELGFHPDPTYYSYEITRERDGTFAVRASGDLDCDGELSGITLRARTDTSGNFARDPDVVASQALE